MWFATGFAMLAKVKNIRPITVLDFGCGCRDSVPVLKMRFSEAQFIFMIFLMLQ